MTTRRAALGLLAAPAIIPVAQAQSAWPDRPITMVVPFAPGGSPDIAARLMAPKMAELLEAAALARLQGQPMAMVRAWTAIARAAGMDKPENTQGDGASGKAYRAEGDALERMQRMTDAELQALISADG